MTAQTIGHIGFGCTEMVDRNGGQWEFYFNGTSQGFDIPLRLDGSAFTTTVWRALQDILAGETRNYSEIAQSIGRPSSVRVLAHSNEGDQIAIHVPCHCVIGTDGSLPGYGGGLWRKQKLLEIKKA